MNSDFKPKLHSYELECYLHGSDERQVENTKVHELSERLTSLAHPTHEDQHDKRWEYFYLPVKRSGRTIAVPVWIVTSSPH